MSDHSKSLWRCFKLVLAITALGLLTACASAPEWADPGKNFDDDAPPDTQYSDPDAPIPNLASVPDRPRTWSVREERDETRTALTADLENATLIRADKLDGAGDVEQASAAPANSAIAGVIYFGEGSAQVSGGDQRVLTSIARLQRDQGARVKVIGHASSGTISDDPETAREANLLISERRAEGVVRALIALGVPPEDLLYSGVGDRALLYDESTPAGMAGNRRAEIFLETGPQAQ